MGMLKGCDDETLISLLKEYMDSTGRKAVRIFDAAYYVKNKLNMKEVDTGKVASVILNAINDGVLSDYSVVSNNGGK